MKNKIFKTIIFVAIIFIMSNLISMVPNVYAADQVETFDSWGLANGIYISPTKTYGNWDFVFRNDGANADAQAASEGVWDSAYSIGIGTLDPVDEMILKTHDGAEFNFYGFHISGWDTGDEFVTPDLQVTGWRDGVQVTGAVIVSYGDSDLNVFKDIRTSDNNYKNVDEIRIVSTTGERADYAIESFTYDPVPEKAGKALTADTTSNDVDNEIEVTFGADATFEGAITGVSFNGTALTVTTDYVVSSGKITLKPSGGNVVLQTPATANVVITATGYGDSTVSQTINAGAVASLEVNTQPVVGAASGDAFGTQPVVKLKDQYGNNCTTGVSATANVVATAKNGTGSWSIGGTTTKAAVAGFGTFTDLTCTLTTVGNGSITFTSGVITTDSTTFTIPEKAGKALTADTTSNDVDNEIEVTFGADATFEGAITGVSFNGTALTVTTDYVVSSGKITLKPSGGNVVLQTPATANVVITATGYGDSTVFQTINAGAVASLEVNTQPVVGAASGDAFGTQPVVKLKDQYGNNCTTGVSATANVVATAKNGTGSWSIGGTTTKAAVAGFGTFTDLTCTLTTVGNGSITFTSGVITTDSTTFTIPEKAGKALTADTTSNDVDNEIEVTFGADATFEGAITGVSFNGTALTVTTDYVVSSGKITLKPSGGNVVLQTPATANVVITATGYGDSTVFQTINAGAVASLEVNTQPVVGAASGDAFGTQPVVKLKDQYGNNCTTGVSATANVVATAKNGTGSWSIGGTTTKAAVAGFGTFTDLTCTLTTVGNGSITFTSGVITTDSTTFTIPEKAGKALTADTTSNDVDNEIEVTFGADATFEGAITGVSFNGTALTVTTDYVVSSGKITLKPSGGNVVLQTPATANVVITATGYGDSTVSQTINAGAVASLEVNTQPVVGAASGDAFGTQPVVKLKDQYGNNCTTGVSATANVVATAKNGTGSWSIGGTTTKAAVAGFGTFTDLTCTLTTVGNGSITFTSGVITTDSTTFTIPEKAGKALTADTTSNDVDNEIEVTFGADATFEGAITGVSFNGTALTVTTDYVVSSGKITLKPSGGNVVLQTPATANVVITATGYGDSTVFQTINAGAVASLEVNTQPVVGAASGDAFGTQPVVKLKDQYGNNCTTGVSATANVVATAKNGTGSWSIGGTTTKAAVAGFGTFTDLTCTLTTVGNGSITFTSGVITTDSTTFTIPEKAGKALTADTTSNDVDNEIEVTFGADATFEGAITGVSFNGTALTVTTDYVVSSGKITLKPSGGNVVLQTPATANVVITATGYGDSTVSQTIKHGAVTSMAVSQNITAPASNGGAFAHQPIITINDAYGNICTSDSLTMVTAAKEDAGAWSLTGTTTATAISGVVTFTNLGATNTALVNNAQLGFTSGVMTKVTSTTITLAAATSSSSSGGGGGGGGGSTATGQSTANIVVNGKTENAGTETTSTESGKSTVTVAVDNKTIESKIEEAVKTNITGQQNVIQVPVSDTKSEVVKVALTGDIVKQLETNTFDVSVKRDAVEYIIPAKELTISNVAKELGVAETSLKDIQVEVKITKLEDSIVAKYNEVAKENGATIVFPPTAFEVVAKTTNAAGKTEDVKISKFSNYVERVMEIPSGVDPSKVTTGIVFNADGTYSHVPTDIYQNNGKWYARLNSLTNSDYTLVWNPVTVKSVENHWAKEVVNDMASRLVIFDTENFEPNKGITRADFAEYIVRALGIYREGEHENTFKDVSATGDRTLAVLIANEYGIVTGYSDGTFRGDNQITREEAMTMYQRAMKITDLTGTDTNRYQSYTDYGQVSKWATPYVNDVLAAHVFNGTTATTISPKSILTYAESAQAIENLLVESKLINQ